MERIWKISKINPNIKGFWKEEYDYRDVIDLDNKINKYKEPYAERILRRRLTHLKRTEFKRRRLDIVYGMAIRIFFLYIGVIIERLLDGDELELKGLGTVRLKTKKDYKTNFGYNSARKRAKKKGYTTYMHMEFERDHKEFRYGYPAAAFSEELKKEVHRMENKGIKYY